MMNNILRSALRLSTMRSFTPLGRRDFTRTFWHMSKPENFSSTSISTLQKPSLACTCGCGSKNLHTKGQEGLCIVLKRLAYPTRLVDMVRFFHRDKGSLSRIFNFMLKFLYENHAKRLRSLRQSYLTPLKTTKPSSCEQELIEFLKEEIVAEKNIQKGKTIPTEIDGFKVTMNGAEVELTKQKGNEKIQVAFNINHTVDSDGQNFTDDEKSMAELKSTPTFEVDIIKSGKTLSFTCSFLKGEPEEGDYNDVFGIDEVTMYEGEWTDKNYAASGDVLDGYFYDLLMTVLEEKGISNDFAMKLSVLSTNYEHATYIGFLESLSKFTSVDK